jgi:hypothetical protein
VITKTLTNLFTGIFKKKRKPEPLTYNYAKMVAINKYGHVVTSKEVIAIADQNGIFISIQHAPEVTWYRIYGGKTENVVIK